GAELSVDYSYQLQDVWLVDASLKGLLPLNQARENWRLGNGVQSNQLQIIQSELQLDLLRQFNQIKLGGWLAYQYHQQSRKNFVINGVQKNIGRITETVQTAWLGAAIESTSDDGAVKMRLEGGLPLWVHTTNSSVKGVFNKRAGFRLGADLRLLLPWHLSGQDMSLVAGYQYKQLGDELIPGALWPKNSWQSMSLGMNVQW
ncbi:MAG: hypothetical protein Q9M14_09245, partial [Mariprofundaceae bacterium]|nr:hypothetical protein [Mariprofundaceae bacterium]